MEASPSVLAVFAHPDDESLAAGGLLARHADAGARTAVVTATWADETVRANELDEALRTLGAEQRRMLGYADRRVAESAPGRLPFCDAPLDETVQGLVSHIREFRPEILVTHDAYGGLTGHPDHVHTHRVTVLAAEAAGLEHFYPEAGAAWKPSAIYLATHPHSALPMLRAVIGPRKAVHTVPDEYVTTRLNVGPWLDRKVAAVLAHRTEVARGAMPGLIADMSPGLREKLLSTEWYTRWSLRPTPARRAELTGDMTAGL
jgi:N-acetyl-1-D-myo-inositol-2-amino-2-deoxy-alpha-D-glucopyranoside deacetylase